MSKKSTNMRLSDAPIYSYWQALYLAFYSSRLYIDVAKRWRGYGLRYLLLVIAILTIPLSVLVIYNFNTYFSEQMVEPITKIPRLYIQNGAVVFDKPMPYLIKNKSGNVVAIVDTTTSIDAASKLFPDLTVLITKDNLYFKPPKFQLFSTKQEELKGGNVYAQPISKHINEVFVGKEWIAASGILKLKVAVEFLVYPIMVGLVYGVYLGVMLFLAFVAQLCAIIVFKYRLSFKDSCRIFFVAATPQTALFFIMFAAKITLPFGGLIYVVLLAIYFNYAVICVKRESNKMVRM